jgi:hypothetical protein
MTAGYRFSISCSNARIGSDQAFAGDEVRAAPVALPLGLGKSIEDERERFRAMWNGRPPTGQEIAEHEATLARIQVLSG